jgi:uncharacterized Zn finger protein
MPRRPRPPRNPYTSDFPPESRPRPTAAGIRARSRRGAFAENWWSRRWIEMLDSFRLGARLQRARRYARQGQVLSIEIAAGEVRASVQGSRRKPYAVVIRVKEFTDSQWADAVEHLTGEARFAAALLAGEMPQDIEKPFRDAGLSLFPAARSELDTDCSCPDWSNPCKHIGAVYYLLGEEFDRDPFLLLALRGRSRDGLFEAIGAPDAVAEREEAPVHELPADPAEFWGSSRPFGAERAGDPLRPAIAGAPALLVSLGDFPFWQGRERPLPRLEAMLRKAAPLGLEIAAGEETDGAGFVDDDG